MTVSRHILRLFSENDVRAAEVARRTKLNPATFTRLKQGQPISLDSLKRILDALGYSQRDDAYLEAMSLWMAENTRTANASSLASRISAAGESRDAAAVDLVRKLARIVDGMTEEERTLLRDALRSPNAIRLWLQSATELTKIRKSPTKKP